MSDEFDLPPKEIEMERYLGALAPKVLTIDERAIWFEAGVQRGRKSSHRWQFATAASLVLAIAGFGWNTRDRSTVVRQPDIHTAIVARGPSSTADTQQAPKSMSMHPERIDDLIKASGWQLQSGERRTAQSPSAPGDGLSATQMLQRSVDPKDFLTMRT